MMLSPLNATNTDVSFATSNALIASVNTSGLVTAESAGTATITVTSDEGSFTASADITVTNSPVLGAEGFSQKAWLTPNPASSFVSINVAEDYEIAMVIDQAGRVVLKQDIRQDNKLDIRDLKQGVYLIQLRGNSRSTVSKLIKKQNSTN